jgi:uncharacterized protein (DUF924 family)
MHRAEEILQFWFGLPSSPDYGEHNEKWFRGGPEFDAELRQRFLGLHQLASAGELDHLREDWRGCLALILLFDQFSRNMFRGTLGAFASDTQALALAEYALQQGYDKDRLPTELTFFYLPFEHSEDLGNQHRSVALRQSLPEHAKKADAIQHAVRHREVLERFGRFPHRNAVLGRISTAEELEFLATADDNWIKSQIPAEPALQGDP